MNCSVCPEIKCICLVYSGGVVFIFFFKWLETFLQNENSVLIPGNIIIKYLDRILSGVCERTAFFHLYAIGLQNFHSPLA